MNTAHTSLLKLLPFCLISASASAALVTSGLQIHLDASQITPVADGTSVTTWADQSGNGRDANDVVGTAPTYRSSSIGGKPAVRFTGGSIRSTFAPGDDFAVTAGTTVFIVAATTTGVQRAMLSIDANNGTTEQNNQFFAYINRFSTTGSLFASFDGSSGNNSETEDLNGPYNDGDPYLFTAVGDPTGSGTVSLRANSGAQTNSYTETVGVLPVDDYTVGALNGGNSNLFSGDIAEIVVYNRVLSAPEISQNEAFLQAKYVPEPSTAVLALLGLLAIGRRRRG